MRKRVESVATMVSSVPRVTNTSEWRIGDASVHQDVVDRHTSGQRVVKNCIKKVSKMARKKTSYISQQQKHTP